MEEDFLALQQFFTDLQNEEDPIRRDQRVASLAAILPVFEGVVDPGQPFSPVTQPPAGVPSNSILGTVDIGAGGQETFTPGPAAGNVGDFVQDPDRPLTLAEARAAAAGRQQQSAGGEIPIVPAGLPPGVSAVRLPGVDFFRQAGLGSGRAIVADLIGRRESQISDLTRRAREAADRAAGLESGDIEFEGSRLPGLFRIATSPEEFAQLRDDGFLPVMAQDAEAIRRLGAEQAGRIRQGAEESLDFARGNRRNALVSQIAAGLGSGIGSAISGTNANVGGELGQLANQVEQVRRELGSAVQNRQQAFERAGEFDTRAQLDSMLAETDAFRQVQQLLVDSARQDELRRFQEIERQRAQSQTIQGQIDSINANAPGFFQSLATIQQFANMRDPNVQLVNQPRSTTDGTGDRIRVSQQTQAALVNAATGLNSVLGALSSRNNLTVPDEVAEGAAGAYLGEIQRIVQDLDKAGNRALLTPEVEQLLRDAIEVSGEVTNSVVRGQRGILPGRDAEDFLENASEDEGSLLRTRLDRILNSTAGGVGTSTTTRSGNQSQTSTSLNTNPSRFSKQP